METRFKRYLKATMPDHPSLILGEREDGLYEDLYITDGNNNWKLVTWQQAPPGISIRPVIDRTVIAHEKELGWVYTEIDLFTELL